MKIKDFIKKTYANTYLWIVLTCLGVWILVFLNIGSKGVKPVYVVGGDIDADVSGTVSVDNTVNVNLHEINGYRNCFYNSYSKHPNDYYRIPISY